MKIGDTVILFFKGQYRCKGFINKMLSVDDDIENVSRQYHLIGLNVDKDVLFYINKHTIYNTRIVLFEKYK